MIVIYFRDLNFYILANVLLWVIFYVAALTHSAGKGWDTGIDRSSSIYLNSRILIENQWQAKMTRKIINSKLYIIFLLNLPCLFADYPTILFIDNG
jgi:hypothetical protein